MLTIKEPNYTQYPNTILDNVDKFEHPEFKLVSVITRKTFGYHRKSTVISLSELVRDTGMAKMTVIRAASNLEKKGMIKRTPGTKGTEWELVVEVVQEIDHLQSDSSTVDVPLGSQSGIANGPPTNTRDLLKKKDIKKEDVIDFSSLPESFSGNKEFTDTWNDWELHRKLIRHKLNPLIRKKQFKKLSSLPLKVAIYTLELAMEKGWTGYHVPKKDDPIWQEAEQESISDDDPWALYKEGVGW